MTITRGEGGYSLVAWPGESARDNPFGYSTICAWSGRDSRDLRDFVAALHALRIVPPRP